MWRVVVCDLETSKMRRLKPATGLWKIQPKGCNVKKTNKQLLNTNIYFLLLKHIFGAILHILNSEMYENLPRLTSSRLNSLVSEPITS
jgi:hypothetical protein